MYLPAIVMVGYYFERRRALATGIAVCGSGIGAFVFAPLCEVLIATCSWKGATLIISGICLNGVVCGLLFIPVDDRPRRRNRRDGNKSPEVPDSEVCRRRGSRDATIREERLGAILDSDPDSAIVPLVDSSGTSGSKDANRSVYTANESSEDRVRSLTSLPPMRTAQRGQGCCAKMNNGLRSLSQILKKMMDFTLLKNPVFCIYGTCCFLCMTGKTKCHQHINASTCNVPR